MELGCGPTQTAHSAQDTLPFYLPKLIHRPTQTHTGSSKHDTVSAFLLATYFYKVSMEARCHTVCNVGFSGQNPASLV